MENKKLRGIYNDPRFHFVLVCGAVSCPPIINLADGSDNPKGRARNRRTAFKVIGELEMDVYYEEE